MPTAPRIWAVVPCMGRLEFLRRSVPALLAHSEARLCLVDYACPQGCGDWIEQAFAPIVQQGRILVERVRGPASFNKSDAHNRGARRVLDAGAQYLCFLDADTVVQDGFWPFLLEHVAGDGFLIAARLADGRDRPSLTGLLVVGSEGFIESGGFDPSLEGWGGEDIDLRIRLRLLVGLEHADVPVALADAIPHDNALRTQFYAEKNAALSNYVNLRKLRYRVWNTWRDRWKVDPNGLERLWYRSTPLA